MRSAGSGSIVNICFSTDVQAMTHFGAYAVAKAGLHHLSKCIAVENFDAGVRSNAILMGQF